MGYDDKIAQARSLIEEHNQRVKTSVDVAAFLEKLEEAGGTTEETLRSCSFEDLEAMGLPRLLAREIARVFRSGGETSPPRRSSISSFRADAMTVVELLGHYDPREADNAVGSRLSKMSKGQRCIILKTDGSVDVESSAKLIEEIREGYPEREVFIVDGEPQPTFKVGERPNQTADVNPLYRGRILRPDGTCDQTNRSWDGIAYNVRALLYLAIETGDLTINKVDDAHDALDRAVKENAEEEIRRRYTKAALRFKELEVLGELPSLKVKLGSTSVGHNNPFGVEVRSPVRR